MMIAISPWPDGEKNKLYFLFGKCAHTTLMREIAGFNKRAPPPEWFMHFVKTYLQEGEIPSTRKRYQPQWFTHFGPGWLSIPIIKKDSIAQIQKIVELYDLTKVAFIRNPVERFYSAWCPSSSRPEAYKTYQRLLGLRKVLKI